MIKYDKLFQTMKERGISQYDLYTKYNVPKSLLDRLRNNKNIETGYMVCYMIWSCRRFFPKIRDGDSRFLGRVERGKTSRPQQ